MVNPTHEAMLTYAGGLQCNEGWPGYWWDDWGLVEAFWDADPDIDPLLEAATPQALYVAAVAVGYLVHARLSPLSDKDLMGDVLEAASVSTFEEPVLTYIDIDYYGDGWAGPVNGPMALAITALTSMLHNRAEIETIHNGTRYMMNLARHVAGDCPAVDDWVARAAAHLGAAHAVDRVKPGDWVPDFFAEFDFTGPPVNILEFCFDPKVPWVDFADQRANISPENRYLLEGIFED